jgi:ribosome-associated protein
LGGSTIRRRKPASSEPDRNLLEITRASLEDDKAEDVVVIELAGKSTIADFMVIATGRSTRQVGAMAENLRLKLLESGAKRVALEGMTQGDWVLLDAGDLIVHLFRPEVRAFYNLEKMWGVDLPEKPAEAATG